MNLELSASSCLQKSKLKKPSRYQFKLSIHESNGSLLLNPIDDTGLLKLIKNAPHSEPESHIQAAFDITSIALQRLNLESPAAIYGLSEKDRSFIFAFSNKYNILHSDILYPNLHPLEVQSLVSKASLNCSCESKSFVVIRHLLEHVRNLDCFLTGLRNILEQGTICFFEVPNSIKLLTEGDLSQLWEEHTIYFTTDTLLRSLRNAGFNILASSNTISDGEDVCMVVAVKNDHTPIMTYSSNNTQVSINFLAKLPNQIRALQLGIDAAADMRHVYIFGANHVAGTFLDIIEDRARRICALIDDDPLKSGHTLGLCQVPIITPAKLPPDRTLHILVAISEGRAPSLYDQLRNIFLADRGHVVESLASYCIKGWGVTR